MANLRGSKNLLFMLASPGYFFVADYIDHGPSNQNGQIPEFSC